jgi:hypothetical protein
LLLLLSLAERLHQEQRRQRLQEACAEDSVAFPGKKRSFDDIPNKALDHLIVDDRHGIIFCYVPKVGQARPPVPMATVAPGSVSQQQSLEKV